MQPHMQRTAIPCLLWNISIRTSMNFFSYSSSSIGSDHIGQPLLSMCIIEPWPPMKLLPVFFLWTIELTGSLKEKYGQNSASQAYTYFCSLVTQQDGIPMRAGGAKQRAVTDSHRSLLQEDRELSNRRCCNCSVLRIRASRGHFRWKWFKQYLGDLGTTLCLPGRVKYC